MIKFKLTSFEVEKLKKFLNFSWSHCLVIKTINKEINLFLCDIFSQRYNIEKKQFFPAKDNYTQFDLKQKSEEDFLVVIRKQKVFKPRKLLIAPIYFTQIDDYEVTISLKDKTIEFLSERKTMKLTYPIEILDQTPTPDSNKGVNTNA